MDALGNESTFDPGQQDPLIHRGSVDKQQRVQREHLQELEIIVVRVKVLVHLLVRARRHR